jgi:hypothetical protein
LDGNIQGTDSVGALKLWKIDNETGGDDVGSQRAQQRNRSESRSPRGNQVVD